MLFITGVMAAIISIIVLLLVVLNYNIFGNTRISCIVGLILAVIFFFVIKSYNFKGFDENSTQAISQWCTVIMLPMITASIAIACLVDSIDFGEAYKLNISIIFGVSLVAGLIVKWSGELWPSNVMLIASGVALVIAFFVFVRDY